MGKDGCNVCCTGIIYIVAVFNCYCCGDVTPAEADRNLFCINRTSDIRHFNVCKNILAIKVEQRNLEETEGHTGTTQCY